MPENHYGLTCWSICGSNSHNFIKTHVKCKLVAKVLIETGDLTRRKSVIFFRETTMGLPAAQDVVKLSPIFMGNFVIYICLHVTSLSIKSLLKLGSWLEREVYFCQRIIMGWPAAQNVNQSIKIGSVTKKNIVLLSKINYGLTCCLRCGWTLPNFKNWLSTSYYYIFIVEE